MKKRSASRDIVFTVAFILLLLYTVYVLFFFAFAFICAVKTDNTQYTQDKINNRLFGFGGGFNMKNFVTAFDQLESTLQGFSFGNLLWNSIWRTVTSAVLSILSSSMVCYVLVFYRSKMTKFIYNLGLFVSILPVYGSAGSTYRLMYNMGLINNPLNMIVSISLYGGYFFYMYSFFKSLSWEYAEAAFVDGAGHFGTFFRVMFPMALPSVSALFIMAFISGWNDYESTLLYMNKYPNLAYGVYAFSENQKYVANMPGLFAGVILTLLPVLLLFIIFQNTIMEKVHLGGLKG
ncbi:MAG: carbohydrate ABC transporter permease [Eubacteriales bacterium]|nr:carbohydrate ABC transporter permease [Eubacteriales bacterium]